MNTARKDKKALRRRDGTGHLDPQYATDLRRRSMQSAGRSPGLAFFGRAQSADSFAESLGEGFVAGITTGERAETDAFDWLGADENGGPFVMTSGRTEFAKGTDQSNPADATREPFPRASSEFPKGAAESEDE
jgi:hypothetical protein